MEDKGLNSKWRESKVGADDQKGQAECHEGVDFRMSTRQWLELWSGKKMNGSIVEG